MSSTITTAEVATTPQKHPKSPKSKVKTKSWKGLAFTSPAILLLSGVAVMTYMTALQTFILQRQSDTIREVYTFILGRLLTAGWGEVRLVLPYAIVSLTVLLLLRRRLDVLSVGDDEAASLGLHPQR